MKFPTCYLPVLCTFVRDLDHEFHSRACILVQTYAYHRSKMYQYGLVSTGCSHTVSRKISTYKHPLLLAFPMKSLSGSWFLILTSHTTQLSSWTSEQTATRTRYFTMSLEEMPTCTQAPAMGWHMVGTALLSIIDPFVVLGLSKWLNLCQCNLHNNAQLWSGM